ncbi:MBOAT family protein [bacterium]|nr:MBOAT family protein [bacterium]
MIFSSPEYFIFFPAVLALSFVVRGAGRMWLLTIASFLFYGAASPPCSLLLLMISMVDFTAAIRISESGSALARRLWMWTSVCANLGILFYFKYIDFFVNAAGHARRLFGGGLPAPVFEIILPVGISFYTLQSLGYTLDVYRGRIAPTRSFLDYVCYLSFFPRLIAGPFVRSHELIPQLRRPDPLTAGAVADGLRLFLMGFVKKTLVADVLGRVLVDPVFHAPHKYTTFMLWLAAAAYAVQLYGDFSGYTDMARGSARLLGVRLPINFNFPYLARDPRDFWARWQITFSAWMREYVFIPLGGAQLTAAAALRNIAIVFLLGGLWHGARWTFVAWGAYHGVWLIAHAIYRKILYRENPEPAWTRTRGYGLLSWAVSFLLILIGCVIMRSPSMSQAYEMLHAMAAGSSGASQIISGQCLMLMLAVALTHAWSLLPPPIRYLEDCPASIKDIGYGLLIIYLIVNSGLGDPFIYF